MLGNIRNGFSLLLRDKNILFKRNNLSQVIFNIRNKQSTVSTKDQHRATEIDNDDITEQPIKYSSTKASTMRITEYRDPHGDEEPWYQIYSVMISLAAFLIYFCILREENDIDSIIYNNLQDTLNKAEKRSKIEDKS